MTERVKPEQDWRAVQGAILFAGQLAILAENAAIRMKRGCSGLFCAMLESAGAVANVAPAQPHEEQ